MRRMNLLTALPLLLLLVMAFAPRGYAQDQQTPNQGQNNSQQMSQDQSISGTLKSVDPDEKKITVTTTDGSDMEFVYNDQTQCTGSQSSIQGLAGNSGSKVTVYYRDENQQKVATRIDVQGTSTTPGTGDQTSPQPDRNTPSPDTQPPSPPDQTHRPQDNPEQPLPAPPHHQ